MSILLLILVYQERGGDQHPAADHIDLPLNFSEGDGQPQSAIGDGHRDVEKVDA